MIGLFESTRLASRRMLARLSPLRSVQVPQVPGRLLCGGGPSAEGQIPVEGGAGAQH